MRDRCICTPVQKCPNFGSAGRCQSTKNGTRTADTNVCRHCNKHRPSDSRNRFERAIQPLARSVKTIAATDLFQRPERQRLPARRNASVQLKPAIVTANNQLAYQTSQASHWILLRPVAFLANKFGQPLYPVAGPRR